jgi:hypothetical protein
MCTFFFFLFRIERRFIIGNTSENHRVLLIMVSYRYEYFHPRPLRFGIQIKVGERERVFFLSIYHGEQKTREINQ